MNRADLFKKIFKSPIFGILSYFSCFAIGYFAYKNGYLKSEKNIYLLLFFLFFPPLVFSFFNLKSNDNKNYKVNFRSIFIYSLTILVVFIFHVFFSGLKGYNSRILILFIIIFIVALSIGHLSYLFVLFTGKRKIKEDLLDN